MISAPRRAFIKLAVVAAGLLGLAAVPRMGHAATMTDGERTDWFWTIIERTRSPGSDQERQISALATELSKLPPDEIAAFDAAFRRQMSASHTWDLWGAAYVIMGGASDDGFEYFRAWLISLGREVFEAARVDPDALAGLIPADFDEAPDFELLAYVAAEAWAERTGGDAADLWDQHEAIPEVEPSGQPFDESPQALESRYPRLWARFSESPLG